MCELCGWVQNDHYFRYPNEDILNRPYTSLNYYRFLHILKQFAESIGSSAYNRFKAPKAIYDVWIRKHPELNGQYNMSEFKLTKPDKDLFLSKEDCWDEDDEEAD
ncbi:hypothetical protein [Calorimonas adulescens]|uniref:hypothetical protein n=1 Tax=Calorimonas adulescens TaxID=2606906 RepID=UPI001396BF92|nr:hypothetical protein [Calorimonas adulescens]